MASTTTQNGSSADAGTPFKLVVRICGLLTIGAIFLPFIAQTSILDLIKNFQQNGFDSAFKLVVQLDSTMAWVTNAVVLLAFILFPLFGLGMLIRGKYAGGPFTFLLVFNLAAFLLVYFFNTDPGVTRNFFLLVEYGYWIACGALFLPFVAMFFLDKSI